MGCDGDSEHVRGNSLSETQMATWATPSKKNAVVFSQHHYYQCTLAKCVYPNRLDLLLSGLQTNKSNPNLFKSNQIKWAIMLSKSNQIAMSRFIWISGYLDKPHFCVLAQSLPVIMPLPASRKVTRNSGFTKFWFLTIMRRAAYEISLF
jgi:hypothetical protein